MNYQAQPEIPPMPVQAEPVRRSTQFQANPVWCVQTTTRVAELLVEKCKLHQVDVAEFRKIGDLAAGVVDDIIKACTERGWIAPK